jgi:hypothetical protein
MSKSYQPLPIQCSLCEVTLEECAMQLGPAFVYTLTVHPRQFIYARRLLHQMGADCQENPFAPYVNLASDEKLEPSEWYLSDSKTAVGTLGLIP